MTRDFLLHVNISNDSTITSIITSTVKLNELTKLEKKCCAVTANTSPLVLKSRIEHTHDRKD